MQTQAIPQQAVSSPAAFADHQAGSWLESSLDLRDGLVVSEALELSLAEFWALASTEPALH